MNKTNGLGVPQWQNRKHANPTTVAGTTRTESRKNPTATDSDNGNDHIGRSKLGI